MSDAAQLDAPVTSGAEFAARTGATDAQVADLARLQALLADWNSRVNLVSAASLGDYWSRHVLDSAQLKTLAPAARVWVDIGAGAGFPGLVLAILAKREAGAKVHLVESQAKRCRFLEAAVAELALPAEVHNARAEDLALKADVVTARAVAPLVRLLGFARPYLAKGATGLFFKSESVEAEITEARKSWRFAYDVTRSVSDSRGRIVKVEGLARV
jgi:16S rRNA (guanine527-N7)-methyltransferase